MEVLNDMKPSDEALARLAEPGPEGPIVMLNLLKFKDRADYDDGSDADLSGRQAYARYAAAVGAMVQALGGRVLFSGDVTLLTIGQAEELWDEALLLEYPNRGALIAMTTSEEYRAISHHRRAGLDGQLNIETTHTDGPTTICDPAP